MALPPSLDPLARCRILSFILCILFFLALDLGVFHRHAHTVKFKEALLWSIVWFSLAMLFALALKPLRGKQEALQFVTGYLIELSLSMDNVFVIALIFAYFGVPANTSIASCTGAFSAR